MDIREVQQLDHIKELDPQLIKTARDPHLNAGTCSISTAAQKQHLHLKASGKKMHKNSHHGEFHID
jgi:hypothetical protein